MIRRLGIGSPASGPHAAAGTPDSKSEPVLRGVARGCTSSQFKLDQPVSVLLSVAAADGQAELAADATLTAAY